MVTTIDYNTVTAVYRTSGKPPDRHCQSKVSGLSYSTEGKELGGAERSSGGWKKPLEAVSISGKCAAEAASARNWTGRGAISPPAASRSPDVARWRFGDLPAAFRLTPCALKIEFSGAKDLVALSQAMANDWTGFMRAVEE